MARSFTNEELNLTEFPDPIPAAEVPFPKMIPPEIERDETPEELEL
jgi:hypothetical protein